MEKYNCIVCGDELNYEPVFCCNGINCGCMGLPIDPPVCSKKCNDELYNNMDKYM